MDASGALKVSRLFKVSYYADGIDFVDQLNYQFTSGMIILFLVMIGFRQYVGKFASKHITICILYFHIINKNSHVYDNATENIAKFQFVY